MPLFVCDRCKCVENTALGDFWSNYYEGEEILCSECSRGKWHGRFPKQHIDEFLKEYPKAEFKNRKQ